MHVRLSLILGRGVYASMHSQVDDKRLGIDRRIVCDRVSGGPIRGPIVPRGKGRDIRLSRGRSQAHAERTRGAIAPRPALPEMQSARRLEVAARFALVFDPD